MTGSLCSFWENVCQVANLKKHSLSFSPSSKKKQVPWKKWRVPHPWLYHELLLREVTIVGWNAVKVFYAYLPFCYTEYFEKCQYLERWIIVTISSKAVLNEISIFFFLTANVWQWQLKQLGAGSFTHRCFCSFSANIDTVKKPVGGAGDHNVIIKMALTSCPRWQCHRDPQGSMGHTLRRADDHSKFNRWLNLRDCWPQLCLGLARSSASHFTQVPRLPYV